MKKKPDISDAEFIKHYNEKHAQAAAPVLLKHKIISYSLVGPSSITVSTTTLGRHGADGRRHITFNGTAPPCRTS